MLIPAYQDILDAAGISTLLTGKAEIKSGPVCVVVSGSNLDKKYFKEALGL